jgi:hypothetical protein
VSTERLTAIVIGGILLAALFTLVLVWVFTPTEADKARYRGEK